jgi:hypothetical protein
MNLFWTVRCASILLFNCILCLHENGVGYLFVFLCRYTQEHGLNPSVSRAIQLQN